MGLRGWAKMGGTDRKMALAGPAVVLRWKMRRPEKFQDAAASTCVLPSAGPYGKVVSGRLWPVVGWEVTRGVAVTTANTTSLVVGSFGF